MDPASLAAVGSGAVGGAVARYAVATLGKRRGAVHPWPTTLVNLAGSFVLGAVVASAALPPRAKLLVGTGFCGSFTTFSTYSVETVQLVEAGKYGAALAHVAINNVGSGAAALAGMALVRRPLPPLPVRPPQGPRATASRPVNSKLGPPPKPP